jgi:putative RecB family exonuclease
MSIYSHSRLSCFEDCPLKYKFFYIDKIEREQEGIEAFMGSRFHEAMQKLYKDLKCKTYSLGELLNYYESQWDKEYSDAIIVTKKDRTAEDYRNIGKKCIEDYYKRYAPFTQGRVLGLEREVMIDLNGDGKYKLRGYMDRLAQAGDDTYEIHDYKTSGFLPEQKHFDEDRQLALYQIGVKNIWNDVKKVNLIWHYVVFDKEMVSTRTDKQLEKLKNDTITLIDKIEATEELLPKESNLCEWCVYPDLCPKRKHAYKVESLPANEYLKDSGVKLVNTYAKLVAKKREHQGEIGKIDEEIDKVKEAVIQYAEEEKASIIIGSNNKLKVTEKQKVSCPPKGSEERGELEKALKEVNKWDEVADIDTYAVEKVINEERWDKKIINKIKCFLKLEIKKSVTLSKLQDKEK